MSSHPQIGRRLKAEGRALGSLLLLLSCVSPAAAQGSSDRGGADAAFHRAAEGAYASGQQLGLAFMITGSTMLTAGGLLAGMDAPSELRPASYPLIIIGLAQLLTGSFGYLGNRARREQLSARLEGDRGALLREEEARMEATLRSLKWARRVEGGLVIAGLAAGFVGLLADIPEATGAGFSTAGGAGLTFVIDSWWDATSRSYLDSIRRAAEVNRGAGAPPTKGRRAPAPRPPLSVAAAPLPGGVAGLRREGGMEIRLRWSW